MTGNQVSGGHGGGGVVTTDSKLYRNFWNLQKYLANPFNIFQQEKLDFEEIGVLSSDSPSGGDPGTEQDFVEPSSQ